MTASEAAFAVASPSAADAAVTAGAPGRDRVRRPVRPDAPFLPRDGGATAGPKRAGGEADAGVEGRSWRDLAVCALGVAVDVAAVRGAADDMLETDRVGERSKLRPVVGLEQVVGGWESVD